MIRPATIDDIPAMAAMIAELNAMRPRPGEIDRSYLAGVLARGIRSPGWLVLVADVDGVRGLLVGSVERTMISPEPVAIEHAWIAAPGWGGELLLAYEDWAKAEGCAIAHLSTLPNVSRVDSRLAHAGYGRAENAWVKAL